MSKQLAFDVLKLIQYNFKKTSSVRNCGAIKGR